MCKSSDAVKLAAIHYYVWHGPYDDTKDAFSLPYATRQFCPWHPRWYLSRFDRYMRELRIGEQLMPMPLLASAQVTTLTLPTTPLHLAIQLPLSPTRASLPLHPWYPGNT